MEDKIRMLAENKVLVSAGVVVIFICSIVYFLYSIGIIHVAKGKQVVESAATSMPVGDSSSQLSDPSAGTQTAVQLNDTLHKQQQAATRQSQNQQITLPTPTKAAATVVTPTTKPSPTLTPTPTLAPTVTPTQVPPLTPTPTLGGTPIPSITPSPTASPSATLAPVPT